MFLARLGIKIFSQIGTALALIVDSTGSMAGNDPHRLRIAGGELVIDQGENDWDERSISDETQIHAFLFLFRYRFEQGERL